MAGAELSLAAQHTFLDASKDFDFTKVRALITANPVYVNVQPAGRWSALHQAAQKGDVSMVNFLLDHGANRESLTKDGQTPLSVAHACCRELLIGKPKAAAEQEEPVAAPAGKPSVAEQHLYLDAAKKHDFAKGSKRKAAAEHDDAPAAKLAAPTACAAAKAGAELVLEAKLLSGEALASVTVDAAWKMADLKTKLTEHIEPGTIVTALHHGETELDHDKTVAAVGLTSGAVVQAVISGLPKLHLFEACSAHELAHRRGCRDRGMWSVSGELEDVPSEDERFELVADGVDYCDMDSAPPVAKEVAVAMAKAAPDLKRMKRTIPEYDGWEYGEICVISNPGPEPKWACLKAFAFRESADAGDDAPESWKLNPKIHEHATCVGLDCSKHLDVGMVDRLNDGFIFSFDDAILAAPVVYGGYASDGSIVGVICARLLEY